MLHLLISPALIADGQVPVPRIGEEVCYFLRFQEQPAVDGDELAQSFSVRAESLREGRPKQGRRMDGTPRGLPTFATHLVGDGWAAGWVSPRRIEGMVEVHGTLHVSTGAYRGSEPVVRGRVVRLRRVIETLDVSDPDEQNWRPIPSRRVMTDVAALPERVSTQTGSTQPATGTAPPPTPSPPSGTAAEGRWVPHSAGSQGPTRYSQIVVDLHVAVVED